MLMWLHSSVLPPHSFIAMDDYKSPAEMADHLHRLIESTRQNGSSEYMQYFEWRRHRWAIPPKHSDGYRSGKYSV